MENVELLELTLDQLGGEEPTVGNEFEFRGNHYRIMNVKLRQTRSSKWKRQTRTSTMPKWSLLVQKLDRQL